MSAFGGFGARGAAPPAALAGVDEPPGTLGGDGAAVAGALGLGLGIIVIGAAVIAGAGAAVGMAGAAIVAKEGKPPEYKKGAVIGAGAALGVTILSSAIR